MKRKGNYSRLGGTLNHVHILARFSASVSVSEMMRRNKDSSSKWENEGSRSIQHFSWQRGYGAFSVSESAVENVISYIGNQDEHHKKITFEEEFLLLLQKHRLYHFAL